MGNRVKEIILAVLFGAMVALIIYAASQTVVYRPFLRIQNAIDDSHFRHRFMIEGAEGYETGRIVIIDIDDRSIQELGRFKLWPRRLFGKVIGNLKREGAEFVFLDVILMEGGFHRDNSALADSVKSAGNVISGYYFNLDAPSTKQRPLDPVFNQELSSTVLEAESLSKNHFIKAEQVFLPYRELLKAARSMGFTNYVPDPDGVLRHIPLYIKYGRKLYPSASLQIWLDHKGISTSQVHIAPDGVSLGNEFIPTDRHCFMRLNFTGSRPVFQTVSFVDVFNDNYEPGIFKGKIVMIGSSSNQLGDIKRIPGFNPVPGVEVHATALSTLLSEQFLTVTSGNIILVITLLTGIFSSVLFSFTSPVKVGLPVVMGFPIGLYLVALYSFIAHSCFINISLPSFVMVLLYIVLTIYHIVEDYEKKNTGEEIPYNTR